MQYIVQLLFYNKIQNDTTTLREGCAWKMDDKY